MHKPASPLVVALGTNLPYGTLAPRELLVAAVDQLSREGLKITSKSRIFRTPCFPAGAGPDYANAVVVFDDLHQRNPDELLQILHNCEASFGRTRLKRWAERTLDLDLIAAGDSVLPDTRHWQHWHDLPVEMQMRDTPDRLVLPHPRLQDRAFVLVPMAEVLPDWRHPVLGKTVAEMLEALPGAARAEVVPYPES